MTLQMMLYVVWIRTQKSLKCGFSSTANTDIYVISYYSADRLMGRYLKKKQQPETEFTAGILKNDQKHTKGKTERFLLRQNKTECKFSRESSSSKL